MNVHDEFPQQVSPSMRIIMSSIKTVLIVFFCTAVFWVFLEFCARAWMCFKTSNVVAFTYGFYSDKKVAESEAHERYYDAQGNYIYHKCKPSDDPRFPVNSQGFRGPEIGHKKPATVRIVCMGGSTTYGLLLPYADTYPKLLQDALDRVAGRNNFDVINAGISAFTIKNVIALYEKEIAVLEPDIIIFMNVFNNLVTDAKDFYFIQRDVDNGNAAPRFFNKIINKCKQYSMLVKVLDDSALKGFKNILRDIHWEKGADAIMRSVDVWDNFSADLQSFFSIAMTTNPDVVIIVLDEPINSIGYPELAAPMEKAYAVQKSACALYANVYHFELARLFNQSRIEGDEIWNDPTCDPIHLSRNGNQMLASFLCEKILTIATDVRR